LDLTITGYHRDFGDLVRHWRTRYLIIPSEAPPVDMHGESGEKLSDEECRLLGTDRLAELFGKARWLGPGETVDSYTPPRFLYTWVDPPSCLRDTTLMESLDQVNATAALGKPRTSDKDLEGMSLASIAKAMREDPTLVRDRHWNRNHYPDSFTGYEFVSWLVRTFRDVSTRQQAAEWGVKLQGMGLLMHVRREHLFMDGCVIALIRRISLVLTYFVLQALLLCLDWRVRGAATISVPMV
jgi:DEP domain-containing protein 5